jgi:hypothetical protein
VIVVVGWANYIALNEAYGYGPPHYGRTTNMDKWSDPLPRLLVINGIAAAIVLGIVLLIRRHGATRRNA